MFKNIVDDGGYRGGLAFNLADERDAGIGGGRGESQGSALAGEEPQADEGDFAGDCFLVGFHGIWMKDKGTDEKRCLRARN